MKTLDQFSLHQYFAVILLLVLCFGQQSAAQTYMNINFTDNSNKYSLLTDVRSISFDGSGGIVIKKTDNSTSTETMTLLKNITLDGTSGGGTALPVELVSFTATSSTGNTTLKWMTATERNSYGFEIQRSEISNQMSEIRAWMNAGFVEGNGGVNTGKEYSFTDNSLRTGIYSYRLKQIDRDGKFEFSNEVEVTVTGLPLKFALEQNYPNPFNPSTSIKYQLSVNGMTTLVVYDALGREIAVLVKGYKEAGTYSATFDASSFSSGIYFAKIQNGENTQIRKMVLMK